MLFLQLHVGSSISYLKNYRAWIFCYFTNFLMDVEITPKKGIHKCICIEWMGILICLCSRTQNRLTWDLSSISAHACKSGTLELSLAKWLVHNFRETIFLRKTCILPFRFANYFSNALGPATHIYINQNPTKPIFKNKKA